MVAAPMQDAALLDGGFADPVFDAQAAFVRIMNAFARPGTIAELGGLARPPRPVSPAAGAALATLADYDTPVWLDAAARQAGMADWLAFHTGAGVVDVPDAARFALCCDPAALPALGQFAQGIDAYPDRSTTILLTVDALDGGLPLRLAGPGIEAETRVEVAGLPADFAAQWHENARRFPRGVDLLLVCEDRAMALPRTTRVMEG
ncbi:phosphonate C-P lyase system protein PhnH [Mangrovibrevibacter kandeliae]|uniref:phosphonate C-P lyase system protein PhnH n=1 Tax=Mangrovibrevibacter kandeliae TaxID=2968473 RepID=UPI00211910BF|nr:phosphonate C-P lyase system protein PhnH [Aurantimonas sp. CSK15Z-1]MCQ8781246.1 phosphonate C-P lyase system protein PhnH [Aurantimonas sp. CSK15Z-1]